MDRGKERERREEKRGGDRGRGKEKRVKGRKRTMLRLFRYLIVSGETQTQVESNLSYPPWWLNLLAAPYKIGAGCPLIILA